jgi:hypothetical protein
MSTGLPGMVVLKKLMGVSTKENILEAKNTEKEKWK